ncbi:hypothetical protein K0T92_05690 [Paenibacillus oenotherae]|uniref:Uncharacterized protein n=1 Tax=Paenibacillus oenotherae TaxID=1435645 RepID=A0ABS7D2R2_9BACL|nr:hypothetical protein [Paenibacillus oenotherae]MBW7474229.1 hypothetical protein [Paenibacillus oenotherae]
MSNDDFDPFASIEFDKFFNGKVPFPLDPGNPSSWLNDYVRDMLIKPAKAASSSAKGSLPTEIFETHHFLIVRIKLPGSADINNVRIMASNFSIKLSGLSDSKKHTIKLPKLVEPRSGKALLKEQVLQIKLRKRKSGEQYYELFIRE